MSINTISNNNLQITERSFSLPLHSKAQNLGSNTNGNPINTKEPKITTMSEKNLTSEIKSMQGRAVVQSPQAGAPVAPIAPNLFL